MSGSTTSSWPRSARAATRRQAEGSRPRAGSWNLFLPQLPPDQPGTKLSNLDYAPMSEALGKVGFASEALNCNAWN